MNEFRVAMVFVIETKCFNSEITKKDIGLIG